MTRAALVQSIEKWKRNAEAETPEEYLTGWRDCPLCHLYYEYNCYGCPISKHVNNRGCDDTPYEAAQHLAEYWEYDPDNPACKLAAQDAAREEIEFLNQVLKEQYE
jgi:hypothetical protein